MGACEDGGEDGSKVREDGSSKVPENIGQVPENIGKSGGSIGGEGDRFASGPCFGPTRDRSHGSGVDPRGNSQRFDRYVSVSYRIATPDMRFDQETSRYVCAMKTCASLVGDSSVMGVSYLKNT